jgi:hypothetical protein
MKMGSGRIGWAKRGFLGGLAGVLLAGPHTVRAAEIEFSDPNLGSWTSADRARGKATASRSTVDQLNSSRAGAGHALPRLPGGRAASQLQKTIKTARLTPPPTDLDDRPAFPIEDGVGAVGTLVGHRPLGTAIVGTILTHEGNSVTFTAERRTTASDTAPDVLRHSIVLSLADGRKITWNCLEADLSNRSGRTLSAAAQSLLDPFAARDVSVTVTYPNGMHLSQSIRRSGGSDAGTGVTMRSSLLSKDGKVLLTSVRTEKGVLGPVETLTRFDGKTTRSVTQGPETVTEVRTDTGKLLEKSVATTARRSAGGKTEFVTTTTTTRYSLAGLVIATVTTETLGNETRGEVKNTGGSVMRSRTRVVNNAYASTTQTDPATGREVVLGRHGIHIYLGAQQPAFFVPRG